MKRFSESWASLPARGVKRLAALAAMFLSFGLHAEQPKAEPVYQVVFQVTSARQEAWDAALRNVDSCCCRKRATPGWTRAYSVQSHKAAEEVDSANQVTTQDPAEAAAWLRKRLPAAQPPQGAPPGYRLSGARVTEVAGRPVGVFLYEEGARKISCFVPTGGLELTRGFDEIAIKKNGLTAGRCRGHQIVSWSGSEGTAVIIGELSDEALLAFATLNFGPAAGIL